MPSSLKENYMLTKIEYGGGSDMKYTYDQKGQLTETRTGSGYVNKYAYDDKGRLASESYAHDGGDYSYTSTHSFSDDGLTETITSSSSGGGTKPLFSTIAKAGLFRAKCTMTAP